MKKIAVIAIALGTLAGGEGALAADVPAAPVYKAPVPMVASGGVYFWVDGSWERVNLPSVGLGVRLDGAGAAGFPDNGVVHSLSQRLDGGSVRGGIGYNL